VTSPPYWALRDYQTGRWEGGDLECEHSIGNQVTPTKYQGAEVAFSTGVRPGVDASCCAKCGAKRIDEQFGLEQTPQEYTARLVEIFREVWRVLRDDGTVWLNLGDSYAGNQSGYLGDDCPSNANSPSKRNRGAKQLGITHKMGGNLKGGDLVGIPWMVAFALRDDGWYLRAENIWDKINSMPESVHSRPTRSHEQVFLLTKRPNKYFYDDIATLEPAKYEASGNSRRFIADGEERDRLNTHLGSSIPWENDGLGRNKRSVWHVSTKPYKGAHFAVFPTALIEDCIKAGASLKGCCPKCGKPWERDIGRRDDVEELDVAIGGYPERYDGGTRERYPGGGTQLATRRISLDSWKQGCRCPSQEPVPCTVLDIFSGSATTGFVANQWGSNYIGIDLNPNYLGLAQSRILGMVPPSDKEEYPFMSVLSLLGE